MRILKGTTLTSKEFAETFYETQIDRHENPEKWRGLKFWHPDLDKITGGLRRQEFIVIAGEQKSGKTMTALSFALNFARQLEETEEKVLFVSLEMSHSALGGRVFSNLASIDSVKFRDYMLEEKDWDAVREGRDKLAELPMLWNVGAYNIEGIEALVEEYDIRVLVIDYFQLLTTAERYSKRHEALENFSLKLKQMANYKNMSVLALSQQSREALKNITTRRSSNTLAGTQALVRDADMLLLILPFYEDGVEIPHKRELYIAESRSSAKNIPLPIMFLPKFSRVGAPLDEEKTASRPPMGEDQIVFWEKPN